MMRKCPLCDRETNQIYFSFKNGGICWHCYDYLKRAYNIILFQRMVEGLEYLAELKEKKGDV